MYGDGRLGDVWSTLSTAIQGAAQGFTAYEQASIAKNLSPPPGVTSPIGIPSGLTLPPGVTANPYLIPQQPASIFSTQNILPIALIAGAGILLLLVLTKR